MIALAGGSRIMGREQSATLRASSTTNGRALVARVAARFKDALRYARSRTTVTQHDEYARDAAKKVLSSERSVAVEYTATLLVDAAARGAAVEAEAAVMELVAAIREARGARPLPTLAEAWRDEEAAEAEREQAEAALVTDPFSIAARERFILARAKYVLADEVLDAVVRMGAR